MAAVDSLIGLIDLRKADGLVLEAGRVPTLLGGPAGGALTMPPLDPGLMAVFLEEMLSPAENQALAAGEVVDRGYESPGHGSFVIKARLEGGRAKMTIRKGVHRRAAPPALPRSAPVPDARGPLPDLETMARPEADANLWQREVEAPTLPGALQAVLTQALASEASDVFFSSGRPVAMKVRGHVTSMLEGAAQTEEELASLFHPLLSVERRALLSRTGSVDFALELGPQRGRFRVNLFRQLNGLAAVLRPIRSDVPELTALGLPRTLLRVVGPPHGLVLMTGPTGSGKSTTLAALLAHVNQTRACHVVTLEDPIEYRYPDGQALFHQREIGTHVESYAAGLRAALRESPDIILVGEMRDRETIALALTAAETGHLVLSTLHAGTAAGAVDRMVNAFGDEQRPAVRSQIAACLRFVVTQHLLPSAEGGRIPVVEQLAVNHAVAAQIRDGRTHLLTTQMELGHEEGMVTLEASLVDLVRKGRITGKTALAVAPNREALEAQLAVRRP